MINSDTKRHIDNARQVLVGVVPNPTSQIDQITNALIYKFMDDMDQSAIKAGGEPAFFTGDLEQYAWSLLMSERVGAQDRMNLYAEALEKFSRADQLPPLFRDIFKAAYLPYRSPETLQLFLKEIEYFDYEHPEDLGDAYEYLLSIMSSQGDAGQFRTPRNIIDFIVDAVNPTKDDKVLDPACGTGGFLVSSYRHILEQHDGIDDPNDEEKPLTPEQKRRLFNNFSGYDIDPGMVRISQVNMYLHQFKNPQIFQYDTLSREERWDERFDVILANPPFMSPQGGIQPSTKFSIQSTRSEVLFVDYIMSHLKPKGRAGIIVPEGIIFKGDNATTSLRKSLVEDGLYAVVSLPSGVFNPYAGVKTSVLLFDNDLVKKSNELLFIRVENDGYSLGAQRTPINKNDLPGALEVISAWRDKQQKTESTLAQWVTRDKVAADGNYNLSANRYVVNPLDDLRTTLQDISTKLQEPMDRINEALAPAMANLRQIQENLAPTLQTYSEHLQQINQFADNLKLPELTEAVQSLQGKIDTWPYVELSKVTTFFNDGNWVESRDQSESGIRLIQTGNIGMGSYLDKSDKSRFVSDQKFAEEGYTEVFPGDVLISRLPDPVGRACIVPQLSTQAITSVDCTIVRFDDTKMLPSFFKYLSLSEGYYNEIEQYLTGASRKRISRSNLAKVKIPLPPLEVQQQIVAELDSYQKIIDGAQQIINNWKPRIVANSDWSRVMLDELVKIKTGRKDVNEGNPDGEYPFFTCAKEPTGSDTYSFDTEALLVAGNGDVGAVKYYNGKFEAYQRTYVLSDFSAEVRPFYLFYYLDSVLKDTVSKQKLGNTMPYIKLGMLKEFPVPLPPIDTQDEIIAAVKHEEVKVAGVNDLLEINERKISDAVNKLWSK